MAERFKMSHTLDGICDRLQIDHFSVIKGNLNAKAVFYHAFQYFDLHLTPELCMDLSQFFIPYNMELRIFFFQKLQLCQKCMYIHFCRSLHAVIENR